MKLKGKASPVRANKLPLTLQALRARAGLTLEDGATREYREFFADFKFTKDPDRRTAVALVAADTILRDPEMLDGTTCFGEGQIDTAVGAAKLVLGRAKLDDLASISGEDDLEQLAEKCAKLKDDPDVGHGLMAGRHLWGMFNTAARKFPKKFFQNGSYDQFQQALLAVASRHLCLFSPEKMDAGRDLEKMISQAAEIADLGRQGRFHQEPRNKQEVAETIMFLTNEGRFGEIHNAALVDSFDGDYEIPAWVRADCGISTSKKTQKAKTKGDFAIDEVTTTMGNGGFFVGRTFQEVKTAFPGYPSKDSAGNYWDACVGHPATHGICSRLYGKMGQMGRTGGVEEGLVRAVTNKAMHHNPKFSRLSLWVELSNGKGFFVHRSRPINWSKHGVTTPPFRSLPLAEGQLEFFQESGTEQTPAKAASGGNRGGEGEVQVVSMRLRAVNYSHMPWVDKAIHQMKDESIFIRTPQDEHQAILVALSQELRSAGMSYQQGLQAARTIYPTIVGVGGRGVQTLQKKMIESGRSMPEMESLESGVALYLRARGAGQRAEEARKAAGGDLIGHERVGEQIEHRLRQAKHLLVGCGMDPENAEKISHSLAAQYPIKSPEYPGHSLLEVAKEQGISTVGLDGGTAGQVAKLATGIGADLVEGEMLLTEKERKIFLEISSKTISKKDSEGLREEMVGALMKRGLKKSQAVSAVEESLEEAENVREGLSRRFASYGALVSGETEQEILSYAAKHSETSPLELDDLTARQHGGDGGIVSMDAPLGRDGDIDMHNFIGSTDHGRAGLIDDSVGTDWMTRQESEADKYFEQSPTFTSEGRDDLYTPLGLECTVDALTRVVVAEGSRGQLEILQDFANLKPGAKRHTVEEAERQIVAMIDLLDRFEPVPEARMAERRRAVAWILTSALNATDSDREGYPALGGKANQVRKLLFEKIQRHDMPDTIVAVSNGMMDGSKLKEDLRRAKAWGYNSVGVCLPQEAEKQVIGWSEEGGVGAILETVHALGLREKVLAELNGKTKNQNEKIAFKDALSGETADKRDKAIAYLSTRPHVEEAVFSAIATVDQQTAAGLRVAKIAASAGVPCHLLGGADQIEHICSRGRCDSVIFASTREQGAAIKQGMESYSLSVATAKDSPASVISQHVDYANVPLKKDGSLDKNRLISTTKIPLGRKILLAAEAVISKGDERNQRGGY